MRSSKQVREKGRPFHNVKSKEGHWKESDQEADKCIDMVTVKSLDFNSIRSE